MQLAVVWFERQGRLALGAVKRSGSARLTLVDEDGETQRLPRRRVLQETEATLADGEAPALRDGLRQLRAGWLESGPPADGPALWERLQDQTAYGLVELAELALGAHDDSALCRLAAGLSQPGSGKLLECFRTMPGGLRRVNASTWAKIRERQAREAAEAAEATRFLAFYRELRDAGLSGKEWRDQAEAAGADLATQLAELSGYALAGEKSPRAKSARKLARQVGYADPDDLLAELELAGVLPRHVNELPGRHDLPQRFPRAAEAQVEALVQAWEGRSAAAPGPGNELEDLRELPTIAIDDPLTREVDDAISAWESGGRRFLAVHIAHVSGAVARGDPLDAAALKRGTSVYFPGEVLPMLPWSLGEGVLSLESGQDRRALSLICELGGDHLPRQPRLCESLVRIDHRVAYDEGQDAPSLARDVVAHLRPVARALRERRRERGAVILSLPQVKLRLDGERRPYLVSQRADTEGHLVVSELMILYNATVGDVLGNAARAALYRVQLEAVRRPDVDPGDPLFPVVSRRALPPGQVQTLPGPQRTMGLERYVQATSPIRRYGDLVAQRQLVGLLRGEAPAYSRAEVEELRELLDPLERRARFLEDERQRFLLVHWLAGLSEPLPGFVSRVDRRRALVWIPELARELPLSVSDDEVPDPGTPLLVEPEVLDPRERVIKLTWRVRG